MSVRRPDYSDRRGDWIMTASGRRFYPFDPRPEDIAIEDIATALAHTCRYTGHVRRFYSVAQHCVLCSRVAPAEHKLAALLHDASEAYLNDIARPVKHALPDYLALEATVEAAIARRFQLPHPHAPVVKEIDTRMLVTEAPQLLPAGVEPWWQEPHWPAPYATLTIDPWEPDRARLAFLTTYDLLSEARR